MDPSRPILLGILIAIGACASWTPGTTREQPAGLDALDPTGFGEAECNGTPDVRVVEARALLIEGCHHDVAVYRRDVLSAGEPTLIGRCALPCADAPGEGVFAYSLARIDSEMKVGPRSEETFVSLESSTGAR